MGKTHGVSSDKAPMPIDIQRKDGRPWAVRSFGRLLAAKVVLAFVGVVETARGKVFFASVGAAAIAAAGTAFAGCTADTALIRTFVLRWTVVGGRQF
jgi:hypothetical protein